MARKKKGPPKGFMSRTPEECCGIIKLSDGKPCGSPRKAGLNVCALHVGLAHQKNELQRVEAFLAQDYPLKTIEDGIDMLAETINLVRQGIIETKVGSTIAAMMDKWIKIQQLNEKYSVDKIAARVITREKAAEFARRLTTEEAYRILQERDAMLHIGRQQSLEEAEEEAPEVIEIAAKTEELLKLTEGHEEEAEVDNEEIDDSDDCSEAEEDV